MMMKALQLVKPRSFSQVQVTRPQLSSATPDRVLIKTGSVSMCGSDIPFFTGNKRFEPYPLTPGAHVHECAGQVIESTSDLFKPGDSVVAVAERDLGLAEFFVALASKTVRVPDNMAGHDACCLVQPLSTVINAVDRLGNVEGKSVAVIGLGSIGLFFCWLLRKRGAGRIMGIDPCARRCSMASELSGASTFPARSIEVVHGARQDPADWEPPEICIEAVGHQMDTLNDCLELVGKYGTVVAFGVPDHSVYAIEFEVFFRKNAQLIAIVTPVWSEYLAKARDLFISCRNELETLVTHRLPIQDAQRAFELYERHDDGIVKAILDASCWGRTCE
jgi:L-iditol 2-dehydrogenase